MKYINNYYCQVCDVRLISVNVLGYCGRCSMTYRKMFYDIVHISMYLHNIPTCSRVDVLYIPHVDGDERSVREPKKNDKHRVPVNVAGNGPFRTNGQ